VNFGLIVVIFLGGIVLIAAAVVVAGLVEHSRDRAHKREMDKLDRQREVAAARHLSSRDGVL